MMNHYKYSIVGLLIVFAIAFGKTRELSITPASIPPIVDGMGHDSVWDTAAMTTGFIQSSPNPGNLMTEKTEVKVTFTKDSLYVFAMLYDSSPDSIMTQLTGREGIGNSEYFSLTIDTFRDNMNGYRFGISSGNSRSEGKISNERYNGGWNVIWNSNVIFNDQGWSVECAIPFSALRFSNEVIQNWRINFSRTIRRKNETGSWNEIKPTVSGSMTQMGELIGIAGIASHSKLIMTPYVSSAIQFGESFGGGSSQAYRGGLDVQLTHKSKINLAMILIPDFGQVTSDNKILNLSYSEVIYGEQRPFFKEGMDLFLKGGLFTTRRIGGVPTNQSLVSSQLQSDEQILDNPSEAKLLNATKVTYKMNPNLDIGIFNASTDQTFATIQDSLGHTRPYLTEPFVNYNIFVLDKVLSQNSYVTFTNTNTYRHHKDFRNANGSGIGFLFSNKENTYSINGSGKLIILDDVTTTYGHYNNFNLTKNSGNVRFNLGQYQEGDTYDPNDLGSIGANNESTIHGNLQYVFFKPVWMFLNGQLNFWARYKQLYKPRVFSDYRFRISGSTTLTNYNHISLSMEFQPENAYNYEEPRRESRDRKFLMPPSTQIHGYLRSDGRKKAGISGGFYWMKREDFKERGLSYWSSIWYRLNDYSSLSYSLNASDENNDHGWVTELNDSTIFGARNIQKIENNFSISYRFSKDLSIGMRVRHYWMQGHYVDFFHLLANGRLESISWEDNNDFNFNAFNIDFSLSWQFLPLSQLTLSVKDTFSDNTSDITGDYQSNFDWIITQPRSKYISMKMIYYFDSSAYLFR